VFVNTVRNKGSKDFKWNERWNKGWNIVKGNIINPKFIIFVKDRILNLYPIYSVD
jgi:hypothetical protein